MVLRQHGRDPPNVARSRPGCTHLGRKDLPPGTERLVSPYDTDARCGVKRTTVWDGYKTHYTEACDDDAPHLITAVDTVPAPIDDSRRIAGLHAQLTAAGWAPAEHFVDAGYTSALRRVRRVPNSRRRSHNRRARKNTVSSVTSSTAVYVAMEST